MFSDSIIIADVDGVMVKWNHGFNYWMSQMGYTVVQPDTYDIRERYDIRNSVALKLCTQFNHSEHFKKLPPHKDAIKYIRKLHEELGFVFHCITAVTNTSTVHMNRLENLSALFGPTVVERLVLTDTPEQKETILEQYKDTQCLWIEDSANNAEYGLKYGLQPLLMDQPYNKNYYNPLITRVYTWKDVYEIIKGM